MNHTYTFVGIATNLSGIPITKNNYQWRVHYQHEQHIHDNIAGITGDSILTFTTPQRGDLTKDVSYIIELRIAELNGGYDSLIVNLHPDTSRITFNTIPTGLQIRVLNMPITAPNTYTEVENGIVSAAVEPLQTINGTSYKFKNWQGATRNTNTFLNIPGNDTTVTAIFQHYFIDTSSIIVTSFPVGITVSIAGITYITPFNYKSLYTENISLSVARVQTISGFLYKFKKWSTGDTSSTIMIDVGVNDTTLAPEFDKVQLTSNEHIHRNEVLLYPNPVTDRLWIVTSMHEIIDNIYVYDAFGNTVNNSIQWTTFNNTSLVNTAQITTGCYHLHVLTKNNNIYRFTFIKN